MPDEPGPPILDLAFLERQTFGDRELEREILALFDAQCVRLLPVILEAGDCRVRADAAHTLTGAASAVGAGQVAALAAAVEAGLARFGGDLGTPENPLVEAVEAARLAVAARLHDR